MENKIIRAAVYTRKSSEEGLEQCRVKRTSCVTRHPQRPVSDFNSLDAQREACKAYIQSQPLASHPWASGTSHIPVLEA